MPKYKTKYRCVKCKGLNKIANVYTMDGVTILACKTECCICNHKDSWVSGQFDSENKQDQTEKYFNNIFKKEVD